MAERAEQEADNVLRRAEEQRRLEAETPGLLGLDVALEDEELQIEREQRFVTADEMRGVVAEFLAREFPGATRSRLWPATTLPSSTSTFRARPSARP